MAIRGPVSQVNVEKEQESSRNTIAPETWSHKIRGEGANMSKFEGSRLYFSKDTILTDSFWHTAVLFSFCTLYYIV